MHDGYPVPRLVLGALTRPYSHELSDCLWSILVLANKCGIDLEAEFVRNTREIAAHVAGELEGHTSTG